MKLNHLASAFFALLMVTGALSGGQYYARAQEDLYIHVMATRINQLETIGEAWQQAAFRQPDLLVIYGSSELLELTGPNQALRFFRTYPTGFSTMEIARTGITSLNLAQDIAAVGPELRGKKVVISFTPTMFLELMPGEASYDGNFSQVHADEYIFSSQLSWDLKQATAKRMLHYPKTLEKDPILRFALNRLVSGSMEDRLLYYFAYPLGKLEILVQRLQDHWDSLSYLWSNSYLKPVMTHKPATIDWASLAQKAEEQYKVLSNNNNYGILNSNWTKSVGKSVAKGPSKDAEKFFLSRIQNTDEWGDLEILTRTLQEFGAQPLLMSRPFNGTYYDTQGVTAQDRDLYYQKLESFASQNHILLVDFKDHDEDKYFSIDTASHTSPKGWIYVDQALDAFYHGTLH